jgi:hypothetical protein
MPPPAATQAAGRLWTQPTPPLPACLSYRSSAERTRTLWWQTRFTRGRVREWKSGFYSVTVQNRTHVYMNFFDHKDLGIHLLQLCPKVVKHPVFIHTIPKLFNIYSLLETYEVPLRDCKFDFTTRLTIFFTVLIRSKSPLSSSRLLDEKWETVPKVLNYCSFPLFLYLFICNLLKAAVSKSDGSLHESVCGWSRTKHSLRYYLGICLEGPDETTKIIHGIRCPAEIRRSLLPIAIKKHYIFFFSLFLMCVSSFVPVNCEAKFLTNFTFKTYWRFLL